MNVVIYARYSSAAQSEQSIEGQLRVCREYAERNNYTVIREYIDRAMTGTNDCRPNFLQMIEDAQKKQFDYIICYKLDRFSRNHYDSVFYKHKLQQYGVRVLSAMEAISDTQEGKLIEGILEIMAEMYSTDLSQKVKRGLKESALKGTFTGGNILYGYKVIDKRVVIDEEKAPAIRYLFSEYAVGKTKKEIIAELNDKGYKTNRGGKITLNGFQNVLKNRKYIGENVFNGIVSENSYPAIIDKELFDRVQMRLKERAFAPGRAKAKVEYLLSGKAFCGHCGSQLVGISGTSKTGDKHCYYACAKRYKTHDCNKSNIKKEELENFVVERTLEHVLKPECADRIADLVVAEYQNSLNGAKIKEYERRLKQIDKELDACADVMLKATSAAMLERVDGKAKDLETEKADVQSELSKLRLAVSLKHTKQDILQWLSIFTEGEHQSLDFRRRLINLFVNAVFVFDDKNVLFYNIIDETPVDFEEMLAAIENLSESADGAEAECSNFKCSSPPKSYNPNHNESYRFVLFYKVNIWV